MIPENEPRAARPGKTLRILKRVMIAGCMFIWAGIGVQVYFLHQQGKEIEDLQRQANGLGEQQRKANQALMPNPKASIFHVPAGGCPAGTEHRSAVFEIEGWQMPACFNPDGDGTIDFIRPGETFHLHIQIPREEFHLLPSDGPRGKV